jgi:hypothetical protein
MTELPPDMQARRDIEDRAIRLGDERRDLDNRVAENTQGIIDLIPEAADAGITFDNLARMVGVSRQTLHRWREIVRRLRAARDEAAEGR